MKRQVVEIPIKVWEFSLQDAEQIVALHRETLRLMNENARLKAEVERLTKAGDLVFLVLRKKISVFLYVVTKNRWNAAKEGKPGA